MVWSHIIVVQTFPTSEADREEHFNVKGNLVNERNQNTNFYCYNSSSLGDKKEKDRVYLT